MNKKVSAISLICTLVLLVSGCGSSAETSDATSNVSTDSTATSDPAAGMTDTYPSGSSEDAVPELSYNGDTFDAPDDQDASAASQSQFGNPEVPSMAGDLQASEGSDVDIDLTTLSSVVIYSVVYNMMLTPEDYMGKKIRMFGNYSTAYEEQEGKRYHACIIQDATQCCAQGIEFELTDDYVFPDDYPEVWDEITVVGTFDIYKDGGSTYATLKNARLE